MSFEGPDPTRDEDRPETPLEELDRKMPDPDRQLGALVNIAIRMAAQPEPRELVLDRRHFRVLTAYSAGLRRSEVAAVLGYSPWTVGDFTRDARRVLKAKTTCQAVATAIRKGLIP